MKKRKLSTPMLVMIAGTRAALGAGVALLLCPKLTDEYRRGMGWALLGIGLVTTIPIAVEVFGGE